MFLNSIEDLEFLATNYERFRKVGRTLFAHISPNDLDRLDQALPALRPFRPKIGRRLLVSGSTLLRASGINREYPHPDAALRRDPFRNSSEQELVE